MKKKRKSVPLKDIKNTIEFLTLYTDGFSSKLKTESNIHYRIFSRNF